MGGMGMMAGGVVGGMAGMRGGSAGYGGGGGGGFMPGGGMGMADGGYSGMGMGNMGGGISPHVNDQMGGGMVAAPEPFLYAVPNCWAAQPSGVPVHCAFGCITASKLHLHAGSSTHAERRFQPWATCAAVSVLPRGCAPSNDLASRQ